MSAFVPDPRAALGQYPLPLRNLHWVPLGSAGGFSGAAVWRGESPAGEPVFALKAWPVEYPAGRLREIHAAMARAGLPFVPTVARSEAGNTVAAASGRVWDVAAWMPGAPDPTDDPSDGRLDAAMAALAALHTSWRTVSSRIGVCPGVARRMEVVSRAAAGDLPAVERGNLAELAVRSLPDFAARAAEELRPWEAKPLPLQLCLRDVRCDHVLLAGDRVTGVIDYGAVNADHPAVDLARLLGDWVGGDPDRVRYGVERYNAAGVPSHADARFVLALADAGLVGGILHWLDRIAAGAGITPEGEARFRKLSAGLAARTGRAW